MNSNYNTGHVGWSPDYKSKLTIQSLKGLIPSDAASGSRSDTPEMDSVAMDIRGGKFVPLNSARKMEIQRNAAYASLREMIDLNETTGDPDPEITERARALLPENSNLSQP